VLTAVVALGLALAGKPPRRSWPRFAVEDVHRFGGLLVGSLVGLHVLTIAIDSFLPFSLAQLVVPFSSAYRPLWTGLGIAAAELLLALAVTNKLRDRLPYRTWRKAHYLNFAVWGAATLHGIGAGTDRSAPWLALLYGISIVLVGTLALWRAGRLTASPAGIALGVVGGIAVLALTIAAGPLQRAPRPWNAASFTERLTGTVTANGTPSTQIVSMAGKAGDDQRLLVRADLLVSPKRLTETSLQLEYLPSGVICRGRVTAVGTTSFAGHCALANGSIRHVNASWQLVGDGHLKGTIHSHA
jgi:sulfoxide reductase heme-binding subunit YedZ